MALNEVNPTRIIDSRHPAFMSSMNDWKKWRDTYNGGDEFRDIYLERFDSREDVADYKKRKLLTPIPSFSKAAINDIRNSIFQRLRDVTRVGGSDVYRQAVAGLNNGVDRRGNTMNAFLGTKVLSELLVMGRTGVYVDNSVVNGGTLADAKDATPYLYAYQIEDILSWTCTSPDNPSQFQSLLLRDTCMDYDRRTLLPMQTFQRFRLLWIDQDTRKVCLQFYNIAGQEVDRDGQPSFEPYRLELDRIPFVMPDLGDSLMKDVCNHDIALLNLLSREVWYGIQANFSIYTEQRDSRSAGSHLKNSATEDGTSTTGGQSSADTNVTLGATTGRFYGKDLDRPDFINPSSEPLKASQALRAELKDEIRQLVNLAVQQAAARGSAEAKSMDNAGLEAGLSFIGLILESTERQIAEHWSSYESKVKSGRQIATIKYPDRYSLKTDADRIDESGKLSKLIYTVPGQKAKREISKLIVNTLLGNKVSVGTIDAIEAEIDKVNYTTSEPNTIIQGVEAGIVSDRTASMALGFDDQEYLQAQDDHAERAMRIAEAQAAQNPGPGTPAGSKSAARSLADPAARGVQELQADTQATPAARAEKKTSRDRTLQPSRQKRVRGNGKSTRVSGASKD